MMDRIRNMLGIARVTMIDDSGPAQELQVDEGPDGSGGRRILNKVRRFADFGFASAPPLAAEVILARLSGLRQQSLVVGSNHQASRPRDLKPGDTVVYDVRGAKVQLTADGLLIDCAGLPAIVQNATTITLKATQKVTIDAPTAEVLHDMTVGGMLHATGAISTDADMTFAGHSAAALRDAYGKHVHGGVKAGTDASGGTDSPA